MQGFLFDGDRFDVTIEDLHRAFYDYGVSSFADFITSLAILRLIYVKNQDVIRTIQRARGERHGAGQRLSGLISDSS
jgi:hypothetical protein